MGTALIRAGLDPQRDRAPAWNLTRPQIVQNVHASHVDAGAELVLTNTFIGASPEEVAAALRLARASGAKYVAGSLWAGLKDLDEQIAQLAAADAIWLESATSAEQALQALGIAKDATALPIVVTCAMRSAPLQRLRDEGAEAAGYNCSPWPDDPRDADILKPDAAGLTPESWAKRIGAARLRGGCCGTSERYLAALRATPR